MTGNTLPESGQAATASDYAIASLMLIAWITSLLASLSALFIGEVMGQTPCLLCWYQRVFMFPLTIMLGIACYRTDLDVWRYALPLAALGWFIAAYHCLVYFGLIAEELVPCSASGSSCASTEMTIFGRLPIPLLSLAAFSLITVLLGSISWRRIP